MWFNTRCAFGTGIFCPKIIIKLGKDKKRECCFEIISNDVSGKIAEFIFCFFNQSNIHVDEAKKYIDIRILKEKKMWCKFKENTDVCSVFAEKVLESFLGIKTSGEDIQSFNFRTSLHRDLMLIRICNNFDLLRLRRGSLLFLVNKQQYIDPNNFNIRVGQMGQVFRQYRLHASHVLFYLGNFKNSFYVGGMNHTSLYSNGVVPVSDFFHFTADFVWTLEEATLYALFAWEVE